MVFENRISDALKLSERPAYCGRIYKIRSLNWRRRSETENFNGFFFREGFLQTLKRPLAPAQRNGALSRVVRFALELLSSHLGKHAVGDLSLTQGKEVLGYITQLSPNVRKYRDGKGAGLADLARLAQEHEGITLAPQTQARILKQMSQFLDWCVGEGELQANPWEALKVKDRPEVHPHGMLSDTQVSILLSAKDRVLHSALLFGLLTGMRSGELCGLMAEDVTTKGNLGRFVSIRPNEVRLLKSKAAEREVP